MPLPLDPNKLRRNVKARVADRLNGSRPSGQPRSGTMAAVRQHLGTIMALREGGATWPDIAAALAEQGIVQGDGTPMTGRHVTALIASIRRQDASRAAARAQAQVRRTAQVDMHHAPEAISAGQAPLRDAAIDLTDDASADDHDRGSPEALFQRLDQKARRSGEAAAARPNFSHGLIPSRKNTSN